MPLPTIANTYRLAIEWNAGEAVNVMHFRKAATAADDIFNAVDGAVDKDMWLGLSSNFLATNVKVQKLDGSSAAIDFAPVSIEWVGGTGGSYVPAVACETIYRTGLAGR